MIVKRTNELSPIIASLKVRKPFAISEVEYLLLLRKKKLQVDLGMLEGGRDLLSGFLHLSLKVDVTSSGNKLSVDHKEPSLQELERVVSKSVYHRSLNNRYWVSLESSVVKINEFKDVKNSEKRKKEVTPPTIVKHGW